MKYHIWRESDISEILDPKKKILIISKKAKTRRNIHLVKERNTIYDSTKIMDSWNSNKTSCSLIFPYIQLQVLSQFMLVKDSCHEMTCNFTRLTCMK